MRASRAEAKSDIPLRVEVDDTASVGLSLVPSMETISVTAGVEESAAMRQPFPDE